MNITATNNFVFVLRDEAAEESEGLWIPTEGRKKPHKGTVVSVGDLVRDKNIRKHKGKKCLFHHGVGFHIPYEGVEYLVLTGDEIIGLV